MPLNPFPDVPNDPGVPALLRNLANALPTAITPLTADSAPVMSQAALTPQWGVFKDGDPVIVPDTILAVEKSKEWRVSDYPVEDGSFQSYNKVETPFDAHVTMTKAGDESERAAFLDTLERITKSLDLYDVVTPEKVYESANIERYNYERGARQGAALITATLMLREVRVTATAAFSNVTRPASADAKDDGTVGPADPTPDQTAAAASGAN